MERKRTNKLFLMSVAAVLLYLGLTNVVQADWETVIPNDSLTPTNFSTYWEWFYPWGDTHNGSAKMYIEQVTLDTSGTATIVAETPDPESEWKYRSGAFNSVDWIICNSQYPEWDIKGEFKAPTVKGSWPAFWPTGAWGWPPEIDILEYKGDAFNWFNTYDGGWETKKVRVADAPTAWHEYRCHLTKLDDTEVTVKFYLDGVLKAAHTGSNFVGEPFDLIVNLQMEGSSGSPGPTDPTYYYARNIVVQRYAVPAPPGPPSAPTNLDATFGDTEITLDWDPSPEWDVDYYTVYRGTTSGGPYSQIATNLTVCAYTDTGLTNGTTYYYVLTATDLDSNESGISNEASETPVTLYPLTVGNYSFELPGTTKQKNWENVPNWSSDSVASDSGVESDYPTTDGIWRGFLMSGDPSVWNLTGHTITSGEKLLLAVDAKSSDNFDIALYYEDNGSRVTTASKTVHPSGNYVKYTLAFSADDVPASVGNTIGIELDNVDSGTSWVGFDNVRLSTSIQQAPDNTPPSPDPMTWATVPYATGSSSIAMVATTANDESGVEYYFSCISGGGHDSGWQASTLYQDTGLSPETTYTYTVKARDKSPNLNQTAESTAESATTDPPGGGLPYSDGFESGDFVTGNWTTSGTAEVKSQAAYEESYGARISGTAWMETAIDTSGYTNIHLKYVCRTFQLDGQSEDEWFYAEWYDGSSWSTVNQMKVGSWTAYDHVLGAGASNNPSFRIRFRVNANMRMEHADIDNIEVTGS
jgi:hypothetical protein